MGFFVIQPTGSGLLIIFQSALMVVGSILESPLLGPRLWRKLPPDLTSAETLNIFKSRIRKNDISSMIREFVFVRIIAEGLYRYQQVNIHLKKSCSLCTS